MLSADGDVLLYKASKRILNDFDTILEQFFSWKKTNCYNEQLFVEYLRKNFGNESLLFIKNLGWINPDHIPDEYKDIKWFNF